MYLLDKTSDEFMAQSQIVLHRKNQKSLTVPGEWRQLQDSDWTWVRSSDNKRSELYQSQPELMKDVITAIQAWTNMPDWAVYAIIISIHHKSKKDRRTHLTVDLVSGGGDLVEHFAERVHIPFEPQVVAGCMVQSNDFNSIPIFFLVNSQIEQAKGQTVTLERIIVIVHTIQLLLYVINLVILVVLHDDDHRG
ncbi:hypothetical protein C8Q75DRAFT_731770 [Abortiporus biennis]|nr:hypothetical protein C8Q75DRAFT_731770 [Abortiporus biennis]